MLSSAGSRETLIGICLLAVLASIAGTLLWRHFDYDGTQWPAAQAGQPPDAGAESLNLLPDVLAPLTPPEHFVRDNLSDKINGKAEYYLPAGFDNLRCQRLHLAGDRLQYVEVFIYDMAAPANAFAAYSGQRREGAQTMDFAAHAYRTRNAVYFAHGQYYVEIIAATTDQPLVDTMLTYAREFVARTPVAAAELDDRDLLPPGMIDGSVVLLPRDAFGFDRLTNVFTAQYESDGKAYTAFVSGRSSGEQAQELAKGFVDMLLAMGGNKAESPADLPQAMVIEVFGSYEIVLTHGRYIAGVHEADDPAHAAALARLLAERLSELVKP